MAAITKEQIKRIYALGSGIGILERGSKDDNLHALVYSITGKSSISELTNTEFTEIEREMLKRMRYSNHPAPLKSSNQGKSPEVPGMMTASQQSLAWRLIYRLCELNNTSAVPGERMRGAIKKILDIDASLEAPMKWINFDDGSKLIEQLKRYVRSAEAREKKKVAG